MVKAVWAGKNEMMAFRILISFVVYITMSMIAVIAYVIMAIIIVLEAITIIITN